MTDDRDIPKLEGMERAALKHEKLLRGEDAGSHDAALNWLRTVRCWLSEARLLAAGDFD